MLKKRLRIIGVVSGVLVGILLLGIVVERRRGIMALSASMAEMRNRGEQLDFTELIPPPVASSQNAAPGLLALTNRLEALAEPLRSAPPSMTIVAPGRAVVSWRLQAWRGAGGKTNTWAELEPALEQIRALLKPAHLALQRDGFDSGFNYHKGLVEFDSPPIVTLKRLASSLSLAVSDALRRGRSEEAVAQLRDLIRLVELEKDERLIISQLVRLTCADMAVRRTWDLLQSPDRTEAQLASVQTAWQPIDVALDMSRALEMERALNLDFYEQLRHSSAARKAQLALWRAASNNGFADFEGLTPEPGWWMEHVHFPLWHAAWSEQDELRALQRWQPILETARRGRSKSWTAARILFVAAKKTSSVSADVAGFGVVRQKLNRYDRARYLFSGLDTLLDEKIVFRALSHQTEHQLVLTALALRRYELRHRQSAPSLAALTPEFLATVPRDPMDGQPLRYRPDPVTGYVLYSVGDDGTDDGGDARVPFGKEDPGSASRAGLWAGRDVVWPQPATAEEFATYEKTKANR